MSRKTTKKRIQALKGYNRLRRLNFTKNLNATLIKGNTRFLQHAMNLKNSGKLLIMSLFHKRLYSLRDYCVRVAIKQMNPPVTAHTFRVPFGILTRVPFPLKVKYFLAHARVIIW